MVDLLDTYYVTKIRIFSPEDPKLEFILSRLGNLNIYLSTTFNPQDDFTTYPEILAINRDAVSRDVTYNVDTIRAGRYLTFFKAQTNVLETHSYDIFGFLKSTIEP